MVPRVSRSLASNRANQNDHTRSDTTAMVELLEFPNSIIIELFLETQRSHPTPEAVAVVAAACHWLTQGITNWKQAKALPWDLQSIFTVDELAGILNGGLDGFVNDTLGTLRWVDGTCRQMDKV